MSKMSDELERKLYGEGVGRNDPEFREYDKLLVDNWKRMMKFNTAVMNTREEIHKGLCEFLGYEVDETTQVLPPLRCDHGFNLILGKKVLINYNCTFLDTAPITIGDGTMIGPDCHFITANHYLEPENRKDWKAYGRPITVGKDCWFGANVTVVPGITIGDGCTVGAGSVVTKDLPPRSVAVGNPARVIRRV